MIRLSDLHLDPRIEFDLIWRYQSADGEMGLRSSHESLCLMAMIGTQSTRLEDIGWKDPRQLEAARRVRNIDLGLRRAGPDVERILRTVYGERLRENRLMFGPYGNVVDLADEAASQHQAVRSRRPLSRWLDRLNTKMAHGRATDAEKKTAQALRIAAEQFLVTAGRRYAAVRVHGRGR